MKIVMRLIPDGEVKEVNAVQPKFLDNKLISQPTVALQMAVREVMNCGEQVGLMLKKAAEKIDSGDGASVEEFVKSREVTTELTRKNHRLSCRNGSGWSYDRAAGSKSCRASVCIDRY